VVECAALEMRFTGNRNVGSNPTLSATSEQKWVLMFGPVLQESLTSTVNAFTRFDCVSAVSGFTSLTSEDGIEVRGVADQANIRFNALHPYFQAEISFPRKNGWMELRHEGALLDRAQLVGEGWIQSAVETRGAPVGTELTLHFVDDNGVPVNGVKIKALYLSDEWGLGLRKRLRCSFPFNFLAIGTDFDAYPCCARQWMKLNPVSNTCCI
jgi:hypothetical protein